MGNLPLGHLESTGSKCGRSVSKCLTSKSTPLASFELYMHFKDFLLCMRSEFANIQHLSHVYDSTRASSTHLLLLRLNTHPCDDMPLDCGTNL